MFNRIIIYKLKFSLFWQESIGTQVLVPIFGGLIELFTEFGRI